MRNASRSLAFAAAAALVFSPTAAAASTTQAPAQASPGPWMTLSMLNPAGATALGGAAAAAQPADALPPEAADDPGGFHPPLPVIAVFLGVIALDIWILLAKDHGHGHLRINVPPPVSPS
jgi:hypothetical protein